MNISKFFLAALLIALGSVFAFGDTLKSVKKRGFLQCGVNSGLAGFSSTDSSGVWKGLDVDVCKAVAAAVLGDASKVKYIPLTAKERFTALQSGEIDILSRNTTWTQTRDTSLGVNFVGINYYDGTGFLVTKDIGVNNAKELDGASVCVQTGTTNELVISEFFNSNGLKYKMIPYETSEQTIKAFEKGRCDVLVSDQSQLYALKIKLKNKNSTKVLTDVVSKEPLGPVVRQGDDKWLNIAKWSLNVLIAAEERGISSSNIDKLKKTSKNPAVRRILGLEGKLGANLGLSSNWSYNIIKQVGNYGESFERNVGSKSPLKIVRGLNAQWKKGGLLYSPPFR